MLTMADIATQMTMQQQQQQNDQVQMQQAAAARPDPFAFDTGQEGAYGGQEMPPREQARQYYDNWRNKNNEAGGRVAPQAAGASYPGRNDWRARLGGMINRAGEQAPAGPGRYEEQDTFG